MYQLDGGMQPGDLSATGLSRGETDVCVAQPVLPAVPEDPGQERNVHGEWQHLPGGHCYDVVNQTKKSRLRGYIIFYRITLQTRYHIVSVVRSVLVIFGLKISVF